MGGEQGQLAIGGQRLFRRRVEQHAAVEAGDPVRQAAHRLKVVLDGLGAKSSFRRAKRDDASVCPGTRPEKGTVQILSETKSAKTY